MSVLLINSNPTSDLILPITDQFAQLNLSFLYVSLGDFSPSLPNLIANYQLPSPKSSGLSSKDWNNKVYSLLHTIISSNTIDLVIYEGTFVYASIIQSMSLIPSSYYIWLKHLNNDASNQNDSRDKYFEEIFVVSDTFNLFTQSFYFTKMKS